MKKIKIFHISAWIKVEISVLKIILLYSFSFFFRVSSFPSSHNPNHIFDRSSSNDNFLIMLKFIDVQEVLHLGIK